MTVAGGGARRPRPGRLARLAPWLLAPAAGALWAACFAREPLGLAPWLALAPLFLLLAAARGRRAAFGLGWLHGTAFWLVSIPWIAPTLETFGGLAPWLSVLLLGALALYLGLFNGLFGALGLPLQRAGGWPALLGLPGLWVALEWLRGWLLTGFPWNLAGYAWTGVPGALPLAAWVGVWGVGFLAVAANAAVALAAVRRSLLPAAPVLLSALLLLPVAGRYAAAPGPAPGLGAEGPGALPAGAPVAIVQPAIYNQVVYDPAATREGYERLFRLSEEACDRPGALVVWPESAAWPFELGRDPAFARDVEAFVEETGCPLLLNSTRRVGGDGVLYYNSAYLVAPRGGEPARYDKRHLVPFGEYVPLAGVFSFIDSLARSAGDYTAAEELRLLPWGRNELGTAICFEVIFPGEVADLVRAGATVLVTITNDAWYGDTWAPWQHFRAAQWRAAETRRPMLRAAITGVSGVIDADGSVRQVLGVGETGILRARIDGRSDLSPFTRAPWAVPAASGLLAIAAVAWSFRRRGRVPGGSHEP
ncbi:MAG TPA: apolipoprotein N-acyltransferase [Thermoanaerobaculia bacterium]|nr:apolipoprotein N-acyltransferase [Thermoanaerobaculia bacterium]